MKHNYNEEEVSVYVVQLSAPEDEGSAMVQLFIHVNASKPSWKTFYMFR